MGGVSFQEHGELPATHTEVTPRGGHHILLKWDVDRPVTNSPGAWQRRTSMYAVKAVTSSWHRPFALVTAAKNVAGQYSTRRKLLPLRRKRRTGSTKLYWQAAGAEVKARARTRAGDNEFVSAVIG